MKTLLVILAAFATGATAYFGLRSKDNRSSDLSAVTSRASSVWTKVSEYGNKLTRTEQPEEQLKAA